MLHIKGTPYKIVNSIFIFILFGVLFYSYCFPYLTFRINSSCEGLPLAICKSRGLSRAFSEIIRFDFFKAKQHNIYSIRIFMFILYQLISRILINVFMTRLNINKTIIIDILISLTLFLFCFLPLVI
jgi:hypothetical protein